MYLCSRLIDLGNILTKTVEMLQCKFFTEIRKNTHDFILRIWRLERESWKNHAHWLLFFYELRNGRQECFHISTLCTWPVAVDTIAFDDLHNFCCHYHGS